MSRYPRGGARTSTTALATLGALLSVSALLAGCGLSSGVGAPAAEGAPAGAASSAPVLADVRPLDDPRDWTGATTAVARDELRPVATDPTPRLPVTVVDAQGSRVTVADAGRVLALDVHGSLARTVAELGLGDRLVGRDVSTQFEPAVDLPLVTRNGHDLNAEAILTLDPTVVLTDTSLGPWDVVEQLRDAGIPVVVLDHHRGLDNVGELTRSVAEALGVPDEGEELARRTEAEVESTVARIADVAPAEVGKRLRMVFLYVRGQAGVYYMFGRGSGADALVDALGGYDVAEEIGWNGMKPVTDEGLVAAQPDVVLMMSGGLESVGGVDGLLDRLPALAQTPAGQHERFVAMDDSAVLGFGPPTAAVLEALAVAVYAPGAVS